MKNKFNIVALAAIAENIMAAPINLSQSNNEADEALGRRMLQAGNKLAKTPWYAREAERIAEIFGALEQKMQDGGGLIAQLEVAHKEVPPVLVKLADAYVAALQTSPNFTAAEISRLIPQEGPCAIVSAAFAKRRAPALAKLLAPVSQI